jgi:acetyl esterase/lipase
MNGNPWVTALLLAVLAAPVAVRGDATPAVAVPDTISPEAQAFLRSLKPRPPSKTDYHDPVAMARLRKALGTMFTGFANKVRSDFNLVPVERPDVNAVWVETPDNRRRDKVILYLHGGGFILGSARTNLATALRIGPAAGAGVLSVDYRLAPEHPYPAALDDALAAYRWLLGNGYDGDDIAVYGDSAGGGLALSLVLAARAAKLPLPAAVAVLSPMVDLTLAGDTRITLAGSDPVVTDGGERHRLYPGSHDPRDPLISPVFADFAGFPPLLIQVGTREMLLSDAARLARRARADGVAVTLDVWDGMWHGWQEHATAPEAVQACAEIATFLRTHLDKSEAEESNEQKKRGAI